MAHDLTRHDVDIMRQADRISKYAREWIDGEYKFYKPYRIVPVKREYQTTIQNYAKGRLNADGSGKEYTNYLRFEQQWYEQDHWAYGPKNGEWYIYRIKMQDGREVRRDIITSTGTTQLHKDAVLGQILDGVWKVGDAEKTSFASKTVHHYDYPMYWSKEFDGKSALAIMALKPKMTFAEIKNVIENEGGSIDSQMIVHAKQ